MATFDWGNISYDTFSDSMGPWYNRQQNGSTRSRSNNENDGLPPVDNPPTIGEIMDLYDQQVPATDPLNEQEQERLGDLSNRMRRLQPLSQDQVYGSGRIAGNPYSIDTRGIATGAANLVKSGVNRIRRNRREGITNEYQNLAGRQQQATEDAENRRELLGDMLPEQFSEGQQNYREQLGNRANIEQENIEQEGYDRRNQADNEARRELEKLRQENRVKIENIRNRDSGSDSDFTKQGGMFRDLSSMADDEIGLINESLSTIDTQIQGAQGDPERREELENTKTELQQRKRELQGAVGRLHSAGANYNDPEIINEYMNIVQGESGGGMPGSELVSENNQGQQMTEERIREIVRGLMEEGGGDSSYQDPGTSNPDEWFE